LPSDRLEPDASDVELAWSSFAHAAVMSFQAFRNLIAHEELIGSAVLVVIGVALIALAPAKQSTEQESAVSA
jgi:hypothetical protein